MSKTEQYQIKPYARLLTMLGDQLIKNERIALMELIKNSYDADSEWVKVSFDEFGDNYEIDKNSKIIIEDAGHGMTLEVIKKSWLNPATPAKVKFRNNQETTEKGRVLQGEKGIGRFSILKLGRVITVITRPKNENIEYVIEYDFSAYDDDFFKLNDSENELFLDELSVKITPRAPKCIFENEVLFGVSKRKREPFGTKIIITDLKGSWSTSKIKEVYRDISRLRPIFDVGKYEEDKFKIFIYKDKELKEYPEEYINKLMTLLEERAVFRVKQGKFDIEKKCFSFLLNGDPWILKIDDPRVKGDFFFKSRFGENGELFYKRGTNCGPFSFEFYFFDFSSNAPQKYKLDKDDKNILKEHRIYLYRDGIRVYPYGDPEDDWLKIDAIRGTKSASSFLSNDQVVGYIRITQKKNYQLKDKTNREGLIEQGDVTNDFIALIQTFLSFIRKNPYAKYRIGLENKKNQDIFRNGIIQEDINELKKILPNDQNIHNALLTIEKNYNSERSYLIRRVETTEELAGVGLSVESASHDIMGIMEKVLANVDELLKELNEPDEIDKEALSKELQSIRGGMGFIESQLKDIQLLFKSSKQRRRNIRVKDIYEKIERIYKRLLQKKKIECEIKVIGSPLIAKTTDAVLLQLFLNLMDNAIYWLSQTESDEKKIEIVLDGNNCKMIFSDNGVGVNEEDAPYIFEPFFSGKGEDGRGLGLYIARQLLERYDYTINLAELKSERKLAGANFVVNFISN